VNSADAIAALRRIGAHLTAAQHPDAPFFAAALAEYESGAGHGLQFNDTLGLRAGRGETAWWETEALKRRDELLRSTAARHFPGRSPHAATAAILRPLTLYERVGWQRHRVFKSPPEEMINTLRGNLFLLLKLGRPLTFKVIYAALRVCPDKPDLRENEPCSNDCETKEVVHR
jgi:hypothetical protein